MQQSLNIGGSMYLEITGNRLDAKFITEDSQVKDQFTIFKNADPLVRAGSNWKYYAGKDNAPIAASGTLWPRRPVPRFSK